MKEKNLFARHFPVPYFLDLPWVGIDISPSTIRFMEITSHSHLEVGNYAEVPLVKPFLISDPDHKEVKDILMKWKKDFNLDHVKVTLPEEKGYLFRTEIELGTETSMRNAIEFVLEENVPLKGDEALFDFRLFGKSDVKNKMKVAVAVFPKEVVNSYLMFFQECGLTPISFLTEAQATSRALFKKDDLGTYMVVNISTTRTIVFILSGGSVQFTSTLSIGSVDFTKALQKELGLTFEQAEQLKITKGLLRAEDNVALDALVVAASAFKDEIEKVSVYWDKHRSSHDASEAINKIVLCGKESLTIGFKEYLAQAVKIPTEVGNVWQNLVVVEEYVPPLPLGEAVSFASAIGLALPERE